MAQEDDLRALGKIMDFMRALSVIFLLINAYWFCYEAFLGWGFTLPIVDKILMNFQRTTSLFSSILGRNSSASSSLRYLVSEPRVSKRRALLGQRFGQYSL